LNAARPTPRERTFGGGCRASRSLGRREDVAFPELLTANPQDHPVSTQPAFFSCAATAQRLVDRMRPGSLIVHTSVAGKCRCAREAAARRNWRAHVRSREWPADCPGGIRHTGTPAESRRTISIRVGLPSDVGVPGLVGRRRRHTGNRCEPAPDRGLDVRVDQNVSGLMT
jgi:hypothetical protein